MITPPSDVIDPNTLYPASSYRNSIVRSGYIAVKRRSHEIGGLHAGTNHAISRSKSKPLWAGSIRYLSLQFRRRCSLEYLLAAPGRKRRSAVPEVLEHRSASDHFPFRTAPYYRFNGGEIFPADAKLPCPVHQFGPRSGPTDGSWFKPQLGTDPKSFHPIPDQPLSSRS